MAASRQMRWIVRLETSCALKRHTFDAVSRTSMPFFESEWFSMRSHASRGGPEGARGGPEGVQC
eukprot:4843945-Pyramimonas_sp.AAC.2